MATAEQRHFSRDYSGLVTPIVFAVGLLTVCVVGHEYLKRLRRGGDREQPLGGMSSWSYGYLYQARSWAKNPSPPHPQQWPLAWVAEVLTIDEQTMYNLRGTDATVFCRILRGHIRFMVFLILTTSTILLPLHIRFAHPDIPLNSMNRVLITALSVEGLKQLWVQVTLLACSSTAYICNLMWIFDGVIWCRKQTITKLVEESLREMELASRDEHDPHPHPHPQHSMSPMEGAETNRGLRYRTVMVTHIPPHLRDEEKLKEYFMYYLSHPSAQFVTLACDQNSTFVTRLISYLFINICKLGFVKHSQEGSPTPTATEESPTVDDGAEAGIRHEIVCVRLPRNMNDLVTKLKKLDSLLPKRDLAHIGLVNNALDATVKFKGLEEHANPSYMRRAAHCVSNVARGTWLGGRTTTLGVDEETPAKIRRDLLIHTLEPFVEEFGMRGKSTWWICIKTKFRRGPPTIGETLSCSSLERQATSTTTMDPSDGDTSTTTMDPNDGDASTGKLTVWDALLSMPRADLDPYQPLGPRTWWFWGKRKFAIDHYDEKINNCLDKINHIKRMPPSDFTPASTAFITFAHPDSARNVCDQLAVHPDNPFWCRVNIARDPNEIRWDKIMGITSKRKLFKDWLVGLVVWCVASLWLIPVSAGLALFNINNIARHSTTLQMYLDHHRATNELLTHLLPMALTSMFGIGAFYILSFISERAHSNLTLYALHKQMMEHYFFFLVVNYLVFFCIGDAALESFLETFEQVFHLDLKALGFNFPKAESFYIGWIIITTATEAGFELIRGRRLLLSFFKKRTEVPRVQAAAICPTSNSFEYHEWLPKHVFVVTLALVQSVENPLFTPFALIYFVVESAVIFNQILHVYSKDYERNGGLLLEKLVNFSLNGLILAQAIFFTFLRAVEKNVYATLIAIMIFATISMRILFPWVVREVLETLDIIEGYAACGIKPPTNRNNGGKKRSIRHRIAKMLFWKSITNYLGDEQMHMLLDGVKQTESNTTSTSEHNPTVSTPSDSISSPRNDSQPLVCPYKGHPTWDDNARLDSPYEDPRLNQPVDTRQLLPINPTRHSYSADAVYVTKALTSHPNSDGNGRPASIDIAGGQLSSGVETNGGTVHSTSLPSLSSGEVRQRQ